MAFDALGQEENRKVDSRSTFVHRINLRDERGAPINLKDEKGNVPPYSPMQTCAVCHPSTLISHGWHFNAMDPSVNPGRQGEPWFIVDATTRTQVPVSYRNWPGLFRPEQFGMTPFQFALAFGRHLPGGGPGVRTDIPDPKARWQFSGRLEIDCMICHSANNHHDPAERARQIDIGQNLKYAPTVAMGLGEVRGQAKNIEPDEEDPASAQLKVLYHKPHFDNEGRAYIDVVRTPPAQRCYYCHTVNAVGKDQPGLWHRDTDVHLVSGLNCVDCHRAGIEHQDTRGYEWEHKDRNDPRLATLSCAGCHLGAHQAGAPANGSVTAPLGGKLGSPMPDHKGLPTIHFEKLSCTACHSGPWPTAAATNRIQTSLAHALGNERPTRVAETLPQLVEPVFLRGADGKIAPHRMVWPNYWGWMDGDTVTPIPPEVVKRVAGAALPALRETSKDAWTPLPDDKVLAVLEKLSSTDFRLPRVQQGATTQAGTQPTTSPATQASTRPATAAADPGAPKGAGQAVYISGGKLFSRADGKLAMKTHAAAEPYAWPLGHDVRPASQSLGVRGCADCHSSEGAIYFGQVAAIGPIKPEAAVITTNAELRGDSPALQRIWNLAFAGRTLMKILVFACAAVLIAVLLTYGVRTLGVLLSRRRAT